MPLFHNHEVNAMSQHNELNQDAINREDALKIMAEFEAANERAERQMAFVVHHQKSEMEKFESLSIKFKKTIANIKRNDMIFNYVLATFGILFMAATIVVFCYQLSVHDFNKATPLGVLLAFELLLAFFIHTVNGLFGSIAKIEEMIGD